MNKFLEKLINIRLWARRRPIRVKRYQGQIYSVTDASNTIYACRKGRYNRYKKGIFSGIQNLEHDYHLDKVPNSKQGTFIDCGANIGELGVWASNNGFDYIAFEPEKLEATCCDINNFNGTKKTERIALWKETTELTFHSMPQTADGSLIFQSKSSIKKTIKTTTLDEYTRGKQLKQPIILKIEAEGAEPEVLMGAKDFLQQCDIVTVDCGFERGEEKNHTLIEINTLLTKSNFSLRYAKLNNRITAMYFSERLQDK